MTSVHYFILRKGEQQGPFSEEQIKSRLLDKSVGAEDLLWHEGLVSWTAAKSLPIWAVAFPPKLKLAKRTDTSDEESEEEDEEPSAWFDFLWRHIASRLQGIGFILFGIISAIWTMQEIESSGKFYPKIAGLGVALIVMGLSMVLIGPWIYQHHGEGEPKKVSFFGWLIMAVAVVCGILFIEQLKADADYLLDEYLALKADLGFQKKVSRQELVENLIGKWKDSYQIVLTTKGGTRNVSGWTEYRKDHTFTVNDQVEADERHTAKPIGFDGTWELKERYLLLTIASSNNPHFANAGETQSYRILRVNDKVFDYQNDAGHNRTKHRESTPPEAGK